MISYAPLFETMAQKGITSYRLEKMGFSRATYYSIKCGNSVSTNTMCNILPDSTNKEMEVNEMPDAHKPATFGSNDDRLEQIPWHSENDPEEAILDELTDLSMREIRTDAEQARLAELFDQLEQFDHPENTLSEEEIEARLRELYERVQMPSAEDSATTAVAQKTKLKNEKSIDDTKTSSIHSRKALKLLPLVAVLVLLIGTVSAQAFGENFFDLFAKWTSEIFYCVKIFEADDYPNMMTTNAISYYKTAVTYQGIVGRYYSACVYCYAEKNGVSDSKPYETVSVRAIR